MNQLVILDAGDTDPLPRLLTELGAAFTSCAFRDMISSDGETPANHVCALIVSEAQLVAAASLARQRGTSIKRLFSPFRRVFIYPFGASPGGLDALGALVGATVRVASAISGAPYRISESRSFCGPFTGLVFGLVNSECDRALVVANASGPFEWLVTIGDGGLVGRFGRSEHEVFVHASTSLFDTDAIHSRNLQAAECFTGLVPLLWFIRHCGTPLSRTARRWANWIIDDPNLAPRYGFIRLPDLADAVNRSGAAVTVGFIPWNHRRTTPRIVRLFRERWPRLAICVHGCNHTASEFAVSDRKLALRLGALALARMHQLRADTGLGFERVMVFPQGRFSAAAMSGLQELDFLATVNTEVADSATGRGVTGGDLLRPALTCFGALPMFLRRPADDSPANFALDLSLGKPCLIVSHHEYFEAGTERLLQDVEALNRLEPTLLWMNLEEGISTTASVRVNGDDAADVNLFATRTHLRVGSKRGTLLFARRGLKATDCIRVRLNGEAVESYNVNGHLCFAGVPAPDGNVRIEVDLLDAAPTSVIRTGGRERLHIAARRYLSELRDNYVDQSPTLRAGVRAVRSFIQRRL